MLGGEVFEKFLNALLNDKKKMEFVMNEDNKEMIIAGLFLNVVYGFKFGSRVAFSKEVMVNARKILNKKFEGDQICYFTLLCELMKTPIFGLTDYDIRHLKVGYEDKVVNEDDIVNGIQMLHYNLWLEVSGKNEIDEVLLRKELYECEEAERRNKMHELGWFRNMRNNIRLWYTDEELI